MGKEKEKPRFLKITVITLVVAVILLGGVFGSIHAKDRIDLDVQKLTTSIRIAEKIHVNVIFYEGFIVMTRPGVYAEKTVAIPTLKSASYKEKTIQVVFQSLFFSKTIDFKRTAFLKTPPPVTN